MRTMKAWTAAAATLTLAFGVAACGDDEEEPASSGASTTETQTAEPAADPKLIVSNPQNASKPRVTIGSKNFTEQYILGEVYAQALEAAGYKVKKQLNLGSELIAYKAVKGGQVSAYPEYVGTALTSFCDVKPDDVPKDVQASYRDTAACVKKEKITALPPTPFTDSNGFAMTEKKAEKLGITKLSDLKGKAQDLTLSGSPECRQRTDCKLGLETTYDLKFKKYVPVELDLRHDVLTKGQADVSVVFTTDGQIKAQKLRLLEDDKKFLPPYNVTMLVRDSVVAKAGPDMPKVLQQVQEGLTTPVMQELNSRVDLDKQKPEDVATDYLKESGYIK